MRLVLLAHPSFSQSQSMRKFSGMLARAYAERGFSVDVWAPTSVLSQWMLSGRWRKWVEYVDLLVIFPFRVRRLLRATPGDTLYVVCDQALGPWVPLLKAVPHVVHCHDLLALRSALGNVPENRTSWTGRLYQRFIRAGFSQARHFISVSQKSKADLHVFGGVRAITSEVVHNGFNDVFAPMSHDRALETLRAAGLPAEPRGMILSVGADVWYKNRPGVYRIYEHYAKERTNPLPLWIVGAPPDSETARSLAARVQPGTIRFMQNLDRNALCAAYSLARALLFPSLAEGFGWPIAEAMACGCPVVTTNEPPMTEVGGQAARYIPPLRYREDIDKWASQGAVELSAVSALEGDRRAELVEAGFAQAARFSANRAIDSYLEIYQRVLDREQGIGSRRQTPAEQVIASVESGG